jgi:DNA polymerase-4
VPKLERILFSLVEDVCSSTRRKRWKAKTITLKLRYASFKTITRATTISPTNDDRVIFQTVKELLRRNYAGDEAVRLLGVHLSQFVDDTELELPLYPSDARRDQILETIERLRDKFGSDVIHLGNA